MEAVIYSFNAITWVTGIVLFILIYRALASFMNAFKEHKNYEALKNSGDRYALVQFYTGIFVSMLCVFVFFLPYIMK